MIQESDKDVSRTKPVLPPRPAMGRPIARSTGSLPLNISQNRPNLPSRPFESNHPLINIPETTKEVIVSNLKPTTLPPTETSSKTRMLGLGKARIDYSSPEISFTRDQPIEILSHNDGKVLNANDETMWIGRVINNGVPQVGTFPSNTIHIIKHKTPDYATLLKYSNPSETKQNKLFRVVLEFVETETRHVEDLALVCIYFIKPFSDAFGKKFAREIFSDWDAVLKVHEQFLFRLVEGLPTTHEFRKFLNPDWNFKIFEYSKKCNEERFLVIRPESEQELVESTKLIREHINFVRNLHRDHFSNFMFLGGDDTDMWLDILKKMTNSLCEAVLEMNEILKVCIPCVVNQSHGFKSRTSKKHRAFIHKCENDYETELNLLKLNAYLIKPAQRITRYPLLMQEIIKITETILPELRETAIRAQEKVTSMVDYVNLRIDTSKTTSTSTQSESDCDSNTLASKTKSCHSLKNTVIVETKESTPAENTTEDKQADNTEASLTRNRSASSSKMMNLIQNISKDLNRSNSFQGTTAPSKPAAQKMSKATRKKLAKSLSSSRSLSIDETRKQSITNDTNEKDTPSVKMTREGRAHTVASPVGLHPSIVNELKSRIIPAEQ